MWNYHRSTVLLSSYTYYKKLSFNHNVSISDSAPLAVVKKINKKNKKKALHECTECDRMFTHRNSLVYHMRSHTGIRPHQCDQCGKSFFASSALKVHLRLHSGDKPYSCEHCGKRFRQWGDLKYHITSLHSAEKNFQCEYCGKEFARKYSLVVHRRIHTGNIVQILIKLNKIVKKFRFFVVQDEL